MRRSKLILWSAAVLLGASGCGNTIPDLPDNTIPATNGDFVYNGHNFGPNRNDTYKDGAIAGCNTANGNYTKDHALYNTSLDYHDGWEHGRLHCKGTQNKQ